MNVRSTLKKLRRLYPETEFKTTATKEGRMIVERPDFGGSWLFCAWVKGGLVDTALLPEIKGGQRNGKEKILSLHA